MLLHDLLSPTPGASKIAAGVSGRTAAAGPHGLRPGDLWRWRRRRGYLGRDPLREEGGPRRNRPESDIGRAEEASTLAPHLEYTVM